MSFEPSQSWEHERTAKKIIPKANTEKPRCEDFVKTAKRKEKLINFFAELTENRKKIHLEKVEFPFRNALITFQWNFCGLLDVPLIPLRLVWKTALLLLSAVEEFADCCEGISKCNHVIPHISRFFSLFVPLSARQDEERKIVFVICKVENVQNFLSLFFISKTFNWGEISSMALPRKPQKIALLRDD